MLAPKLVVVDDQPVFRHVVRDIVEGHFDIVAQPETLADVWAAVRQHRPDVVIIDINLDRHFRGRDGVWLARELVADDPRVKIVLVSGFMETAYKSVVRTIPRTVFIEKAGLTSDFLLDVLHGDLDAFPGDEN